MDSDTETRLSVSETSKRRLGDGCFQCLNITFAFNLIGVSMPLYHDERLIKKIWELKRKHPDWGVRRIGYSVGVSKDTVHRILKRIRKGDIVITEGGDIIDRSKARGIVAYQKAAKDALNMPTHQEFKVVEPVTGNQQDFPWLPKILEILKDAGRIASKYFSKPENIEPLADLIVFVSGLIALKTYLDLGINSSRPLKTLKDIVEKYERHKGSVTN